MGRRLLKRRSTKSQVVVVLPIGVGDGPQHHSATRTRSAHLHLPWRASKSFCAALPPIGTRAPQDQA
jgi:hypothetical protein